MTSSSSSAEETKLFHYSNANPHSQSYDGELYLVEFKHIEQVKQLSVLLTVLQLAVILL